MRNLIQSIISAELRFVAFIVIIFMSTQLISFSDYQLSNHYDIEHAEFYIFKSADYAALEETINSDLKSQNLSEHVIAQFNKEESIVGFTVFPSENSTLMHRITTYIDNLDKTYKTLNRKTMQLSYQYERMHGASLISGYLIALLLLSLFWHLKERKNEDRLSAVGWNRFGKIIFFSIAFILLHNACITIISVAADTFGYQSPDYFQTLQSDYDHAPLLFIALVLILAPLLEEVLFRGLMYRVFLNNGFPIVGAFVVSGMFTLIHGSYSFAGQKFTMHDPIYATAVFTGSLGLCWMYQRFNTLIAPIILHFFYNAATLILLLYSVKT